MTTLAAVRISHGTVNAIAFASTFATMYCVVDTGRLRTKSRTLSFLSCTTPPMTRKMFRTISTQMSDTPPT